MRSITVTYYNQRAKPATLQPESLRLWEAEGPTPIPPVPTLIERKDFAMDRQLLVAVPAVLFILSCGVANAGESIKDTGAMACVTDKWEVKEPEKGHKLVDAAMRCVLIPDDRAEPTISQDCIGNYEYMPDESWKGSGTCTDNYPDGKINLTWEEGSDLKEYTYSKTGGTGKYQGVTGGGTYMYQNLTDTLSGGRYKGTIQLP